MNKGWLSAHDLGWTAVGLCALESRQCAMVFGTTSCKLSGLTPAEPQQFELSSHCNPVSLQASVKQGLRTAHPHAQGKGTGRIPGAGESQAEPLV